MDYLKIVLFAFSKSDEIIEFSYQQFTETKDFIEGLIAEFNGVAITMDESFTTGLADRPNFGNLRRRVNAKFGNGAFRELIKWILENPEMIEKLIGIFVGLDAQKKDFSPVASQALADLAELQLA